MLRFYELFEKNKRCSLKKIAEDLKGFIERGGLREILALTSMQRSFFLAQTQTTRSSIFSSTI